MKQTIKFFVSGQRVRITFNAGTAREQQITLGLSEGTDVVAMAAHHRLAYPECSVTVEFADSNPEVLTLADAFDAKGAQYIV